MHAPIDGLRIAYTDQGHGLPPLLFVHGFPLSRGAWQHQIEAFGPTHRVVAPDLRGLGESEASEGPTSMARFADDLEHLLRQLGTGPVVLVGHSMGGYVALAFQDRHPGLLRGLVLVGTRAGADAPEAAAKRRAAAERVRREGISSVVDDMAPKMLAVGTADGNRLGQVRALMQSASAAGVAGALLGMAERPDATPRLGRIGVPTLVITGAEDTVIPPSESEVLARSIPGADLEVIPRAGHLVAFEQAEAFNDRLAAWLRRLPAD
jgi:pimeloyl-ACP methyl ester carboxylesterase